MKRKFTICTAVLLAGLLQTQAAPPAAPQGFITGRAYLDISGTAVTDLTNNPKFPNNPDALEYLPYFEWNPDPDGDINIPANNAFGENYGAQVLGYFYPPVTGDYVFWLAADDGGSLYLSTDTDPANKKLIARETGWSNPRSWDIVGGGSVVEEKNSSTFTATQWPTRDPDNGGAKITLQANTPYYIEALVKEAGGGDNLAVAVQAPDGSIEPSLPIPGNRLSTFDLTLGAVSVVMQPQSQNANEGDSVTFSVLANGTPPFTYQWKKDGVDIPDATSFKYTLPRVFRVDNNSKFSVAITGGQGNVTSAEATLTVNTDTTPPSIVSAAGSSGFNYITVKFSEPLDPVTAGTASNYTLSGGVTVSAAAVGAVPDDDTVVLTTSPQAEGTTLTLTVSNVKDLAGNTIPANSTLSFLTAKFAAGWATYERWHNEVEDPGNLEAFATAVIDGTIRAPDFSSAVTQFGGPWGVRDNYSSRVSGFFIPPANGNYVFFVASDDQSNLYLSTDENPANRKLIAQETGWSNQYQWQTVGGGSSVEDKRSDQFWNNEWPTGNTITLTGGRRYYIELLHDEGGGGDGSDVTFIRAEDPDPPQTSAGMNLRGSVIGTFLNPNGADITITRQPANTQGVEGKSASLSVAATGTSAYGDTVTYQWQKNGTNIPGATFSTYTTPALTTADNNAKYKVLLTVPTLEVASQEVTLTVVPDTFPPEISVGAVKNPANTYDVGVTFDEPVDAAAGTQANYTISGGTVTAFKYYPNSPGAVLTVSGLTPGTPYTVTVQNVADTKGNRITSASKQFTVGDMAWGVVGGSELGIGNGVVAVGEDGFDLYSDSIGEWATYDEATFVYEEVTGDFDKKLRVEYQDASSQWARAGLIARDVTNFGVGRDEQEAGAAGRYQKVHVNPVLTAMGTAGNNSWETNRRLETGGATTATGGGGVPAYPNAWVRMQRAGDVFTLYRSDDGANWTQLGTTTFPEPMPATLFVGPEFAAENGNIPEESGLRAMWLAKIRDYGNTFEGPGGGDLTFARTATGLTLTFTGTLQSADTVLGPWTDMPGASPQSVTFTGNAKFYRIKP